MNRKNTVARIARNTIIVFSPVFSRVSRFLENVERMEELVWKTRPHTNNTLRTYTRYIPMLERIPVHFSFYSNAAVFHEDSSVSRSMADRPYIFSRSILEQRKGRRLNNSGKGKRAGVENKRVACVRATVANAADQLALATCQLPLEPGAAEQPLCFYRLTDIPEQQRRRRRRSGNSGIGVYVLFPRRTVPYIVRATLHRGAPLGTCPRSLIPDPYREKGCL